MLQITMEISAPIRRIFLEIQTTKIILGQLERIQKMFLVIRPTKTIGALVAYIQRMFSEIQTTRITMVPMALIRKIFLATQITKTIKEIVAPIPKIYLGILSTPQEINLEIF